MVIFQTTGVDMRLPAFIGVATTAVCLALAVPGNAAEDKTVRDCLAAETYPDGREAYYLCIEAIKSIGLDAGTRARINLQLGEAFYFAHRPGPAIPYLDAAIKDDSKLEQARRRRGWSYLMTGFGSKAMADFTVFLDLAPEDPDAQFAIAFARHQTVNDCQAAVRDYESILARNPDHYITRFNLAAVYKCVDRNPLRQLAEYDKVIASGRENVAPVHYYSRRGAEDYDFYAMIRELRWGIYWDMGRVADAAAESEWLVNAYPGNSRGYTSRSFVKYRQRDFVGSLADSEAALGLDPYDPDARKEKVKALAQLDRHRDVVDYTTQLIESGHVGDETSTAYFWRAIAHKQLGMKDESVRSLNIAMAMNEDHVWSVYEQLNTYGYIFGRTAKQGIDATPDYLSKPFKNALEACMADKECLR